MIGFGPNITTSALSPGMNALLDCARSSPRRDRVNSDRAQSPCPPRARQARIYRSLRPVAAAGPRADPAHRLADSLAPGSIDFRLPTDDDWHATLTFYR